jgi:hypothetical protein
VKAKQPYRLVDRSTGDNSRMTSALTNQHVASVIGTSKSSAPIAGSSEVS